jgi:hypothetical protein
VINKNQETGEKMRGNTIRGWWVIAFLALYFSAADAQMVSKENAYQLSIQPGWTRAENLPQGIDVGFQKETTDGDYATFHVHYEVVPAETGEPPSDTSALKQQWDRVVANQYPDVRSVTGNVPKVGGKILINGIYEFTDNHRKLRRRYTYFLSGRTAFVVQCTASPTQWANVSADFDTMLASLRPGSSSPVAEMKSDAAALADLKRDLPTLFSSFPSAWRCSLSNVTITPGSSKIKRTLEIALSFDRPDIGQIYKATKTVFGMIKTGRKDSDLNNLPLETQKAASNGGEFIRCVSQAWGLAWGRVANCSPAIQR